MNGCCVLGGSFRYFQDHQSDAAADRVFADLGDTGYAQNGVPLALFENVAAVLKESRYRIRFGSIDVEHATVQTSRAEELT